MRLPLPSSSPKSPVLPVYQCRDILDMAPPRVPTLPPRERTIANITFITSPPGAKVDIITANGPDNSEPWRAIAIQSGRVRRSEVLSAGGRTEDEAMLALHVKASQAVHHFLASNGPSYPPAHGPEYESDTDEEDSAMDDNQEVDSVSDWSDALSDESDGEAKFAASRRQGSKTVQGHGDQNIHTPAARKARPRPQRTARDDSGPKVEAATLKRRRDLDADMAKTGLHHAHDQPADRRNARPTEPQRLVDHRAASKSCGKFGVQATTENEAQLPRQQTTTALHQIASNQATANMVAVDSSMPTRPACQSDLHAQRQATSPAPAQYPVRLTISTSTSHSLAHHSPVYQLITTLPAPSLRALVGSAVGYIRTMPIPGVAEARPVPTLRARVKRVKMDDVMWDMGGFRADDLAIFFSSGPRSGDQSMPHFELEVEDATGAQAAAPCATEDYAGVLSG